MVLLEALNPIISGGTRVSGGRSPPQAEVILEVDSGGVADLLVDRRLSHKVEGHKAIVRLLGGGGERRLRLASGSRGGGEGVEEALGEIPKSLFIPLHRGVTDTDAEKEMRAPGRGGSGEACTELAI